MKKLNWHDFSLEMEKVANDRERKPIHGVIVYKQENWSQEYSLEARSYKVSSRNKAFEHWAGSNSLFGSSLDGTDEMVRLDWYGWKIDYCYLLEE